MAYSNTERQRNFKTRMHEAGFKRIEVWIKRKLETRKGKIDFKAFIKKMKNLTSGWNEKDLSQLLNQLIKITEAKKEVFRIKEK